MKSEIDKYEPVVFVEQEELPRKRGLSRRLKLLVLSFITVGLIFTGGCHMKHVHRRLQSVVDSMRDSSSSPCPGRNGHGHGHGHGHMMGMGMAKSSQLCKQSPTLTPDDHFLSHEQFQDEDFKSSALKIWSESVQIPTMSYDDMGPVGEDSRWDIFKDFHAYLEKTFPEIYQTAQVEKINSYGLLFTFPGLDAKLKPAVFMAHQDVVPVPNETLDSWTYPPFEGHFDGEFLWGRGVSDCKTNMIGIMQAFTSLVKQGFQPTRTFIISLGFSEEIEGDFSAFRISEFLYDRYGPNGLAMVIDEGSGFQDLFGSVVAAPSLGEKGYVDINIKLNTPGGHSSIPPDHTGIGILSEVITKLEAHKHKTYLTPTNPMFSALQCLADYQVPGLDSKVSKAIKKMHKSEKARKRVIAYLEDDPMAQYFIRTSQAIDIIKGGAKINALPEEVEVSINHRIVPEETVADVEKHVLKIVKKVACHYGFAVQGFNSTIENSKGDASNGLFTVTKMSGHESAPVTRSDDLSWDILSGTVKHTFSDLDPLVVPTLMVATTDTKYFWKVTDHIYRFGPFPPNSSADIHTVNERATLEGHIDGIEFYYDYIRNIDRYGLDM